jgi:myo-inositol-1(or 4)-monophosphatase
MSLEPTRLLEIAVSVTRGAADLARQMRAEGVTGVTTKSTATDVVTAADQATERYVRETLGQLRPGDAVLGEEAGESAGAGTVRWIVDPIDGTVNYLYGIPHYAVSLAAEVDGVVVAGVVRNAATGEEWTATRGGGAWRGGVRLSGSEVSRLGQALIATGFGYASDRRVHQARVVAALLPRVRDIRRLGVASLDLCFAAEGRVDGYYEKGLNLWDHAAGGLIATEAGLRVSGLAGAAPGPNLLLAAPAGIWAALHDALVDLDAAGGP